MFKIIQNISLPTKLILIILSTLLFGSQVPTDVKALLYTLSLAIKAGLIFVLPFIVMSCAFSSVLEMRIKGAISTLILILLGVCFSNFLSTLIAFSASKLLTSSSIHFAIDPVRSQTELQPLLEIALPPLLSNGWGLLLGLIMGVLAKTWNLHEQAFVRAGQICKNSSYLFLNRIFVPLIPVFVLGFSIKLQHDHILVLILKQYSLILSLVLGILISYIGFLYFTVSGFSFSRFQRIVRNVVPSVISGFSTMSSVAALPLTLEGSERNTQSSSISRVVVPMTVNNHLIGDSVFIPFIGMVLVSGLHQNGVSMGTFLEFAFYFVMAKFAVAAVPGGGIIVMIPILEKYLGLNSEMLSLITALYILFDPFITAANVAGNGVFSIWISRVVSGGSGYLSRKGHFA